MPGLMKGNALFILLQSVMPVNINYIITFHFECHDCDSQLLSYSALNYLSMALIGANRLWNCKKKARPLPVGRLNKHKISLGFYSGLNSLLQEESGKRLPAFYASYCLLSEDCRICRHQPVAGHLIGANSGAGCLFPARLPASLPAHNRLQILFFRLDNKHLLQPIPGIRPDLCLG